MGKIIVEATGYYYAIQEAESRTELIKAAKALKKGSQVRLVKTGENARYPEAIDVLVRVGSAYTKLGVIADNLKHSESGSVSGKAPEVAALFNGNNSLNAKVVDNQYGDSTGWAIMELMPETARKLTPDQFYKVRVGSASTTENDSEERKIYIIGTGNKTGFNPDRFTVKDMLATQPEVPVTVSFSGSAAWVNLVSDAGAISKVCNVEFSADSKLVNKARAAGFNQEFCFNSSELNEFLEENVVSAKAIGQTITADYIIELTGSPKKSAAKTEKVSLANTAKAFLDKISEANKQNLAARVDYLLGLRDVPTTYVNKFLQLWSEKDAEGFTFDTFVKKYEDVETMGSTVMSLACQNAWDTGNIRFVGPKGCGKNMAVLTLQSLWGGLFQDNSINAETTYDILVGAPAAYLDPETKQTVTGFRPSQVVEKIQKYGLVNLDEINLAAPGSLMCFQPVLDRRGYIEVPEQGKKKRHKDCVITCTMNEGRGYVGTRAQNEAFEDRFATINVPGTDDITAVLKSEIPALDTVSVKAINTVYKKLKASGKCGEVSIRKILRAATAVSNGVSINRALTIQVAETAEEKYKTIIKECIDRFVTE